MGITVRGYTWLLVWRNASGKAARTPSRTGNVSETNSKSSHTASYILLGSLPDRYRPHIPDEDETSRCHLMRRRRDDATFCWLG
jgi:hypothetical protein